MPHWCKIAGLIVIVPLIVAWLVFLFFSHVAALGAIADFINGNAGVSIAVLAAAMLMAAFSRERDEDEYIASVRAKYLMLAFYIDFAFLIVTAFTVHDLDYLNVMAVQMFLILFLHIVMFNVAMAVIRRRRSHEE